MKKTLGTSGIIIILIVIMSALAGCSSGSKVGTTTAQSTAVAATSGTKTTTATTAKQSGGALADILGRAASISSWQCDLVQTMAVTTTLPGAANGTTTTHIWVSHNKMKLDTTVQGQEMIQIIDFDAKTDYLYYPAQNMANKGTFDPSTKSMIGDPNSILQYNPSVLGTETISGNLCQIIQYTNNGTTTKIWIWEAKGLAMRAAMTSAQGSYTIDYKNYNFSAITDNTFTLPAGVKIVG